MTYADRSVHLLEPTDATMGMCNLCTYDTAKRRRAYRLEFVLGNMATVIYLCRQHVMQLKRELRGTVA